MTTSEYLLFNPQNQSFIFLKPFSITRECKSLNCLRKELNNVIYVANGTKLSEYINDGYMLIAEVKENFNSKFIWKIKKNHPELFI